MPPRGPTGFDGLSSFATDADAAIAEADRIAAGARPVPMPRPQAGPPAAPVDRDGGAFLGGLKKIGGWVIGIGLILAIKACFFAGTHAVFSGSSSPSYDQSTTTQGYSESGAMDGTSAENMTADDSTMPEDGAADGGAGEPVADPSDEQQPLPGTAVLTMAELQYCLAEDIRISAQNSEMENLRYADTDRFNRNVDDFNSALNDYNSDCSNRQIIASQRSIAETNVNARRNMLEVEGRNRVQ